MVALKEGFELTNHSTKYAGKSNIPGTRARYHGAFIWRRRKYELADFSNLQSDATITDLPLESNIQWVDYTIVIMKCPYCEEEWKQHKEFPPDRKARCPNEHLISFDKALKNE